MRKSLAKSQGGVRNPTPPIPDTLTRGSNFLPENVTAPRQPATEEGLLPILPAEKEVEETSRISYQRKVGSILFAAILTRPDIVFAAIY